MVDTVAEDIAVVGDGASVEDGDLEWYKQRSALRKWNERLAWATLAHLGRPMSFLDIGCGDAWMVRTARMTGARPSVGIESSPVVKRFKPRWAQVIVFDMSQSFFLGRKFDMVMSVGVGQHIPDVSADVYVDNLVNHAGYWLVFSAESSPIPDEGTTPAVNVQQQAYWRAKLVHKGLIYDQRQSDNLRATWSRIAGPLSHLPRNLQVFRTHPPQSIVAPTNGVAQ